MVEDFKNENLDICHECGGRCCIKCGCVYAPSDFRDLSYKGLLGELSKGDKSIAATMEFFSLPNGKLVTRPVLHVRARNVGRDVVDLVSMKKTCALLNVGVGCSFDYGHRPLGGRNLVPSADGHCHSIIDTLDILRMWEPYQKQLGKIVKKYTGMSVSKRVSHDVENLFFDVLSENYQGVSRDEIEELKGFIPELAMAYPNEGKSAYDRYRHKFILELKK